MSDSDSKYYFSFLMLFSGILTFCVAIYLGFSLFIAEAEAADFSLVLDQPKNVSADVYLRGLSPEQVKEYKAIRFHSSGFPTGQRISVGDYDVEVYDRSVVDNGVEFFVRAWDKSGLPVGFGVDGTVEYERFRFVNPPLKVPSGEKVMILDDLTGEEILTDVFVEDAYSAFSQVLNRVLSMVVRFGADNIVNGKLGSTVTTVYPEADPASVAGDGKVVRNLSPGSDEAWLTIIAGAGTAASMNASNCSWYVYQPGSNQWRNMTRNGFSFDTSSLGSDVIDSGTVSLYGTHKTNYVSGATWAYNLYSFSPASSTTYVASEYQSFGSTAFSNTLVHGSWNTAGYNDFPLNSSGLSYINGAGVTDFGLRETVYDVGAVTPPTSPGDASIHISCSEVAGTSQDPMLVITSHVETIPEPDVGTVGVICDGLDIGTDACATYELFYVLLPLLSMIFFLVGFWLVTR